MRRKWLARWRSWCRIFGGIVVVAVVATTCSRPTDGEPTETIELTKGPLLSGSGDTVDFTKSSAPALASNGNLAVARVAATRGSLAIYDANGRLVQVLGRTGQGPGEFGTYSVGSFSGTSTISGLGFGRGDSLFVGDAGSNRISVFSPPPVVRFIRSFMVPRDLARQVVVTREGFITSPFMTSSAFTSGRFKKREPGQPMTMVGVPPRLFSWDGDPVGQYGPTVTSTSTNEVLRQIAVADSGQIWSANRVKYQIELQGRDSIIRRRLVRNVAWFPPDTASGGQWPWERPRPFIADMSSGADGLLWVLIKRAGKRWRADSVPTGPVTPATLPKVMQGMPPLADRYEGVLEVLDPISGKLLGSQIVAGDMMRFIAPGKLYQQLEDSTGVITLQIWNATLKRH